MPQANTERIVVKTTPAIKNQLEWLALKHRMTKTAFIETLINERFLNDVPDQVSLVQALAAVEEPDFVATQIPFDAR